ncbi:ABC transporter permease [Ponticoccus sp. SC2-23]|uniref:ABC transporter permease n=1 Tax=Alexandriicola marinus TaxID=2081710 RepID=UPI000FDBB1E1|nr:ABC transporter permease [Alexandriicola marinus]MBM1221331.1 ABC transporter permease [Ponticoccus sp. SC6-9]MBM1225901.1 ABC transporter permease [Ponticoccus sp. SC6-15]MBM1228053.1 ABC transporter permease [Ponticoccus sp. SC6-38]MBM1234309.1 ABC transporter permease [Ponticoccus sp. SC6-45]MBM1238555.1 ABC transporter permease [Ponticoccus sp. SC6-49]MBM1243824.1 ABC transporter permease [Ponticoccus sp. SC2-64]MBM1247833.1 ABC transporter permease [Ponticoccus sp. SC6-42]MBM1252955
MAELSKQSIGSFLARQGILVAFVIFMVGFALANQRFIAIDNISGVIRSSAILGVMALGVTFVVIGGNLDLSVGSMMSFSTIVVLDLHDKLGPALAIPAMFGMTLALGAFIGFLVGYLKLNSLIVTLGMLSAIHGLTLTYSGGQNMDIADKAGTWFSVFGQGRVMGIPVPILIFALLAVVLSLVLSRTPFGRKVYAVGGNGQAATFSGIPRARVVFMTYLISAFCVATAGLLQASRSMGSQNTVGQGMELEVLAAVILGGASLLGGSGTIFKTVIGVLILGFIQNGLLLVGLEFYFQYVVTWVIIILAVWLDIAAKRGRIWSPIA